MEPVLVNPSESRRHNEPEDVDGATSAESDAVMENVLEQKPRGRITKAEDDLVERASAGDQAAFDELVRRHFARVYGLLFRLVGNHEDAEDLAQESFVRAHLSLGLFRGQSSFATWVWRIALHLSQDHHRRRGVGPVVGPLVGDELVRGGARTHGPSDEVAGRELKAGLERALERLPERLRSALVLRVFEGLEYEQVARITGVTQQTARTHVMKARRQLARWLEPWLGRSGEQEEQR